MGSEAPAMGAPGIGVRDMSAGQALIAITIRVLLGAAIMLSMAAVPAHGHPGRLNKEGCHVVHRTFVYKDGTKLKAGSEHCHRPLGQQKLDGKELLQWDPRDLNIGKEIDEDLLQEKP